MKKAVWTGAITAAALVLFSTSAIAQAPPPASDSKTVQVNAQVNAKAKLALGATSISFADADPDLTPVLPSTGFSVDVKARTSSSGNVLLQVNANDLSTSGSDTIAISNLRWTASGLGFTTPGTMSTSAVTAGSWTGSGNQSGTNTYTLQNSWAYNTGTYSTTITYTLTAP